jgi:hypothetical protein
MHFASHLSSSASKNEYLYAYQAYLISVSAEFYNFGLGI